MFFDNLGMLFFKNIVFNLTNLKKILAEIVLSELFRKLVMQLKLGGVLTWR
jgi:hypothetical protein